MGEEERRSLEEVDGVERLFTRSIGRGVTGETSELIILCTSILTFGKTSYEYQFDGGSLLK